jgi:uncharacterized cupredoxin-like copper-binding protein
LRCWRAFSRWRSRSQGAEEATRRAGRRAAPPRRTPVAAVSLKETEFKLDPANPKVAKTGVVAFKVTNSGKVEHNLEVEGPSGEAKLPENIKPGGSATLEVNVTKPGKYER